MNDLADPIFLSLRIALCATAITALIALPLAFWIARRKPLAAVVFETILLVPLVLPPTVVGYLLIFLFGANSWIGAWIESTFHYKILFSIPAAVIAAVVVSFPLLYLPAKSAFASIAHEVEETAYLMGANKLQIFWHVSLPLARRGILSGLLLAFARSLGEFGATVMVFGTTRPTLPVSVYLDYESDQFRHAMPAVMFLSAISLAVIILYNRLPGTRQE